MSEKLNRLYSSMIKEHNERPTHFEKKEGMNVVTANNLICGDRFEFYVRHDQRKIDEMYFYGFGCAVSKASGSVLTKLLAGQSIGAGIELCDQFINYLNKDPNAMKFSKPEEFEAFNGVWEFPARYDCAASAWKEARAYLQAL